MYIAALYNNNITALSEDMINMQVTGEREEQLDNYDIIWPSRIQLFRFIYS